MIAKDSTVVIPDNPYIAAIREAVDHVYAGFGLDPVCTSGHDGQHMKGSMHDLGRALDIRVWDLLNVVRDRIRAQLPPWYDVVIEKDHIHVEADLRKEAAAKGDA